VIEQLGTRTVYRNAWMTVREDSIAWPDGTTGIYGVVDKPDFALIIPRETGGVWLVEQYRYPVGRRAWEFPQGTWSGAPGGDQSALARAELAEETGLTAGRLEHIGRLFSAYGFCSQGFDVFVATELTAGEPAREPGEQDMVHRFVTDAELTSMILTGEVVDAATIAAHALLQLAGSPRAQA
jgi:8-oxo-dGTP pyrophosphatase MutT (NUDIX family)